MCQGAAESFLRARKVVVLWVCNELGGLDGLGGSGEAGVGKEAEQSVADPAGWTGANFVCGGCLFFLEVALPNKFCPGCLQSIETHVFF